MMRWRFLVCVAAAGLLMAQPALSAQTAGPDHGKRLFSMHGSNTIGARLAPTLVEAFLRHIGGGDVAAHTLSDGKKRITARLPGEGLCHVEIAAEGSSTGFRDFLDGKCDVIMSSRRARDEEAAAAKAKGYGDLTRRPCEHVLGMDGIAVIVNRANPVERLTLDQLARIFTGEIDNWKLVGGASAPVRVFVRDRASGTFAVFRDRVLGLKTPAKDAKMFHGNGALSRGVLMDASAIGFVGLPYVGANRALALSDGGAIPLRPSVFTVRTEDYVLSRRLYLYQAKQPKHPLVSAFIPFALADEGQKLVKLAGFVDLSLPPQTETVAEAGPTPSPVEPSNSDASAKAETAPPVLKDELFIDQDQIDDILTRNDAPKGYRAIAGKADRLKVNFRFETDSNDLDALARADIDRLIRFMGSPKFQTRHIILAGFADSRGDWDYNRKLSKNRAEAIFKALKMAGLPVTQYEGFSEAVPVGSNETPEGRALNRRVEVWLERQ